MRLVRVCPRVTGCPSYVAQMPEPKIWPLEPHTKAKHEILRRYLAAWFPIMASAQMRILYLDGFAGPGVYEEGEPGSPIIAIETLLDSQALSMEDREFNFVFMENRADRADCLRGEIEALWARRGGQPSNISVEVWTTPFQSGVSRILEVLDGKTLAPTFAFVDPFGWSGAPMDIMAELLNSKCELLFTFIYDQTSRFIGHPNDKVIDHLEQLFGSSGFKGATELSGSARKLALLGLFESELRRGAGFEFVHSFEMINSRGKTPYFLVHASNHIKGAEKIKDVLWNLDPSGEFRYSSVLDGQPTLFEPEPDIESLTMAIHSQFASQTVTIGMVETFVIGSTPFARKHVRQSLKVLEARETIAVANRKKRNTYPSGTLISFTPG